MPDDSIALLLMEHNECVTLWGGGATACMSHRMHWDAFMDELGETPMTDDERKQLADLVALMPKVRDDAVFGKNNSKRNETKIDGLIQLVGALGERIVGHEDWQKLTEATVPALHKDD
ncbi:hypothetical protein LCGC14_0444900 [marine sediment metagenome]|uniref:Uncharacterized protein n=1 Tax=marine sediment metagenome TaxID=412755 RepID=A0A0F9VTD6_9ZZZZ